MFKTIGIFTNILSDSIIEIIIKLLIILHIAMVQKSSEMTGWFSSRLIYKVII